MVGNLYHAALQEELMKRLAVLFLMAFALNGALMAADEPLSTGRYVTGGVIGSAIGFGIGHAIQGRYIPLGLIFTLGEGAGLAAAIADSKASTTTGVFTSTRTNFGTAGVIGLIVLGGLHVWEIVDVWVTGNELRRHEPAPKHASLAVFPTVFHDSAPGVVVGMNF
jgi:hypothetical protein